MHNPTVSVVTPSYNQAQFIEDTLRSVSRQRYGPVEHFVVDGQSTDGTVDILKRNSDIKWISESDEGQSNAINKGFDRVGGDIIGWLNSDDVYFDKGVLERVVEYFQRTNADIVYGNIALIGPNSDVLAVQVVPDFDNDRLLRGCFIEQPALFFRDYVLDEHRLDNDLAYVIDYEFWLRLANEYEFYHVNDILAGDRNHSDRKILSQRDKMQRESHKIQQKYGAPDKITLNTKRWIDLLASGIPRAGQGALQAARLHREKPEFAFDGDLRPINEMVLNAFRFNKNLVPNSE